MPSIWSAELLQRRTASRSMRNASSSGRCSAPTTARRTPATAIGGCAASSSASSTRSGLEFGDRVELVHETDRERGRSVDLLRSQDHVERVRTSDGPGQPGGAAPRGDGPEIELRQPDARALRSAARRKWHASGSSSPPPRQYPNIVAITGLSSCSIKDKHAQPLIEHRLESAASLRARHQLLEVHADAEMLVAGRGDHDRASVAIVAQRDHGAFELVHVLERHPVPRRILVLEDHHAAATLDS